MESEKRLIERIVHRVPSAIGANGRGGLLAWGKGSQIIRLGVGDDSALIQFGGAAEWAVSCDAFLEGVHFLGERHPADSVGYKSLVRAASDLVAMGAEPRMFLLTLALPVHRTGIWLDRFLAGMARAARLLGMRLVGGDTTEASAVSISITVFGDIAPRRALTRAGARAGDILFVTGRLGGAQLGWELVQRNVRAVNQPSGMKKLLQPHLYPKIRTKLGAWLANERVASAMMDISDGLSTDLERMCEASGVGARIRAARIPCVKIPVVQAALVKKMKLDPLRMAIDGGEDYELLFTASPKNVRRLRRAPGFRDITAIGEMERGRDVWLVDDRGGVQPIEPGGWDSFRKT